MWGRLVKVFGEHAGKVSLYIAEVTPRQIEHAADFPTVPIAAQNDVAFLNVLHYEEGLKVLAKRVESK